MTGTPTPLELAIVTAAASFHARLLATRYPPEIAQRLARVAAEICVEAAWPIFKHLELSAWQRERA